MLGGTRSLFHLSHYLLFVLFLLFLLPDRRRKILGVAILPFLLLASLSVKNAIVFDMPGTSSWLGMSMAKVITEQIPPETRLDHVASKEISSVSMVDPYSALSAYHPRFYELTDFAHIPAVSQPSKTGGHPNFNHLGYLEISRVYRSDAVTLAQKSPSSLISGTFEGWTHYFRPTSSFKAFKTIRPLIATAADFYDSFFLQVFSVKTETGTVKISLILLLLFPCVLLFTGILMTRSGAIALHVSREQRALAAFCAFNIAWIAFVGNTLEVGENHRFRFLSDPLTLVLTAMMMATVWKWLKRHKTVAPAQALNTQISSN